MTFCLTACTRGLPPVSAKLYRGPTDPIETVIAAINQNNLRIPTLWANHDFEATVIDPQSGRSQYVNGFGTVQYTGPLMMRLRGKKELADLFDMGSDGSRFWMRAIPENDTLWWANFTNVDKPCISQMPLRPDLILEVLGIRPIETDLSKEPVPILRFNNDADSYMVDWMAHSTDRWLVRKEIWYDRASKQPSLVLLFDSRGRVVLRALLANFQPVELPEGAPPSWPIMATHFSLYFPDTGSKMSLNLSSMTISHNGFPRAASYGIDFSQLAAQGTKVIPLDENCP